jgi:FkbM family methyltransferase
LPAIFGVGTIVLLWRGDNVLFHKAYWTLFRNSDICTPSQAWAGLGEYLDTEEASKWAAARSRFRGVGEFGLQEWDTPFGVMWFPRGAEAWTVHFALAQFKIGAYPGAPIRAGDTVIDCGGYVGDWTKWALLAGASRVVTVEPAAAQLECIRRNLAEEIRQGRVILYPKGVWDREERLYLSHNESNPAADAVTGEKTAVGEYIDLTTIDSIVTELKLDRVDVLKMDIEGAEIRAIRGARNSLNRFRPRLAIATEHTPDMLKNNRDVIRAIREVAPFYRMRCGYCAPIAEIVTPQTLYFVPSPPPKGL